MGNPVKTAASKSVIAELNYATGNDENPKYFNDTNERQFSIEPHEVEIINASALEAKPTLDKHGFQLFSWPSAVPDLSINSPEHTEIYRTELTTFLETTFDADEVCLGGTGMRRQEWAPGDDPYSKGAAPAAFIHSDTSYAFGPDYLRMHSQPKQQRKVRRAIFLNMWRLCSAPPTNLPLAVLDSTSIEEADLLPATSTLSNRSVAIQMLLLRYNPAHRWHYFANQTMDDLLVFKQWDSDTSQPWTVPHSAFVNNEVGEDAVPRVSREGRAVLYYYDD